MGKQVLIIGAGPAGVSAALTLRMRNIDATVLHTGKTALEKAHRVDNYPGLPRVSGKEMEEIFIIGKLIQKKKKTMFFGNILF